MGRQGGNKEADVMFYSGQKVVCIDAAPIDADHPNMDGLQEGGIYTVLDVTTWHYPIVPFENGLPILRLYEIERFPDGVMDWRLGFLTWRFRPLCERKTSIEVFKQAPVPEPV